MELFQWKNGEELEQYIRTHKERIGEELSDVLYWVLLMSRDLGISIEETFLKKLREIEEKYPVDKARGNHKKYSEL